MNALTYYTNPQSRGRIAHWMLEELGEPYDTVWLDYGTSMKAPDYLAINPMGKVPALRDRGSDGDVVVTYADCPLTTAGVIAPLFDLITSGAHVAVLGFEAHNPTGYGRLILAPGHVLLRIVEEKEADLATKQVKHCNSGVLAADRAVLFDLLANVRNENAKGEYYLTVVVGLAHDR